MEADSSWMCSLKGIGAARKVVQRKLESKIESGRAPKQNNNGSVWTLTHETRILDIMLRL